jgi:hypothetical protein
MKPSLFFALFVSSQLTLSAQDTFYVKRKTPPQAQLQMAAWDTTNRDSIVSYTIEYQKPNSNIFVVEHKTESTLWAPWEVARAGRRVLFTDIIAVDNTGRKYRLPDRYYVAEMWVPVKVPK